MTTFMFPGQGAQSKGMGAELFVQFPEKMKMAREVLGYSIEELCLDNPQNRLANTQFTQPALFIVETLDYEANYSQRQKPDYCIGHSIGEYAALYVAKAFDFITGLRLIKKRGELMAKQQGGGMLAVLNTPIDIIKAILQSYQLDTIDFANLNSNNQVVLSGLNNDINKVCEILTNEELSCVSLNVSGPFHSRYMETAATEFEQFLYQFEFSKLQTNVIANATAQPYTNSNIKSNLAKQITSPVRWNETLHYLKNKGDSDFVEIGPGQVLTRLLTQN